jgi:hypothetical protein
VPPFSTIRQRRNRRRSILLVTSRAIAAPVQLIQFMPDETAAGATISQRALRHRIRPDAPIGTVDYRRPTRTSASAAPPTVLFMSILPEKVW